MIKDITFQHMNIVSFNHQFSFECEFPKKKMDKKM